MCVYEQIPRSAISQESMGRMASFSVQMKPAFVPDSEAFNFFIGDGFRVPELKGGTEASDGDKADNVSNEALNVIGLHGSGDKISLCLQDWEMAKVSLSCHMPRTCCARKCTNWTGSELACRFLSFQNLLSVERQAPVI